VIRLILACRRCLRTSFWICPGETCPRSAANAAVLPPSVLGPVLVVVVGLIIEGLLPIGSTNGEDQTLQ